MMEFWFNASVAVWAIGAALLFYGSFRLSPNQLESYAQRAEFDRWPKRFRLIGALLIIGSFIALYVARQTLS